MAWLKVFFRPQLVCSPHPFFFAMAKKATGMAAKPKPAASPSGDEYRSDAEDAVGFLGGENDAVGFEEDLQKEEEEGEDEETDEDEDEEGEDDKKDVKEVIMKKPAGKMAKRPAAQEENGEVKKRPAAAGGGRHSKKARRFNAMEAAGTLPAVAKDEMAQLKNEQAPGNSFFKLIVITRAWY